MALDANLPESRMPVAFSEDDFIYSKFYKCINFIGEGIICDLAREMYSHISNTNNGEKRLSVFLDGRQGWPKKRIKDTFTKLHRHMLDENLKTVNFDISFSYVLMAEVCEELFSKLKEKCKDSIEYLKKMRNKVCHVYGIQANELSPQLEELKNVLEEIYIGIGEVLGKASALVTQEVNKMKKDITDIRDAQVRQDDFTSYLEDVRLFRKSKKFCMINKGREECRNNYSKLQILNPCTWMSEDQLARTSLSKYQIDKIFTPLKIEDSRSEIHMENILNVTKIISGERKVPTALLMKGLAGCGKTSLCHFVIHDWYKEDNNIVEGIKDFDLVIFVEVRRIRSKNVQQFIIEDCLRNTCKDFSKDDVIPTLQDLEVLFVIDGFDEAKKDQSLEVIRDIFCKFDDKRILLTTRPEFHSDTNYTARNFKVNYLNVEICGFDKNRMKLFAEKVFRSVEPEEEIQEREIIDFHDYIDGPGKVLNEHLKLPLTLALLIYLWRDDKDIVLSVTSATQLYHEIFKLCQKRLRERLRLENPSISDKNLDGLLLCLGGQSWSLLLQGDYIQLSNKEYVFMKRECKKKNCDVTEFLSAYLCCETDEDRDTAEKIFAFLHRTQMEYLAAVYLADSLNNKKETFEDLNAKVKDGDGWRKQQEVVKFLTGSFAINKTLKKDVIPEIFAILNDVDIASHNYNYWWSFFTESLKNEMVGMNIIGNKLPVDNWELDKNHVISGLNFYFSFPIKLDTLVILISSEIDPNDIKELLPLLEKIKANKTQMRGRFKPMVELHLENHYYYHSNASDQYVMALQPWSNLTKFTGKLEKEKVLNNSFKLKNIRIRLNSVEAVQAFKNSFSKFHKNVKVLRMTLGVPTSCPPSELPPLEYRDTFELTLQDITDEDAKWIEEVVKHINGSNGLARLTLEKAQVSYRTICQMLKKLHKYVRQLELDTMTEISDDEMKKLDVLQRNTQLEIVWLDP